VGSKRGTESMGTCRSVISKPAVATPIVLVLFGSLGRAQGLRLEPLQYPVSGTAL
jgi:hypothetical protein